MPLPDWFIDETPLTDGDRAILLEQHVLEFVDLIISDADNDDFKAKLRGLIIEVSAGVDLTPTED